MIHLHQAATYLLTLGADPNDEQDFLQHKTMTMSLRYAHLVKIRRSRTTYLLDALDAGSTAAGSASKPDHHDGATLIAFRQIVRGDQRRHSRGLHFLSEDNLEPAARFEHPQEFIGNSFGSLGLRLEALRNINAIHV